MDRHAPRFYEFGPFRVDTIKRLLLRNGEVIAIKPKAFDLLVVLIERRGEVVEKDDLMDLLWPDTEVEEGNITFNISTLRNTLGEDPQDHRYVVTLPRRGYRFVAEVKELDGEGEMISFPAGGAVPLDSKFYVERTADTKIRTAIIRQDSIVLLKGPSQVGKTSLLARGLQIAREAGAKVILTDFQQLNAAYIASIDQLLPTLAEMVANELELESPSLRMWNPKLSPNINLDRYFRHEVFPKVSSPIVWGMDNVDRLFACDYGSEVFALFRSWHNNRALDPGGKWRLLTLAMAYATEAHLFIPDANRSPFNVGTRLFLEDFSIEQLSELNCRYEMPLRDDDEIDRFFRLVGGHPYLTSCSLAEMRERRWSLADLETCAEEDDGLFSNHLRRVLDRMLRDESLRETLRSVLQGQPCPDADSFYNLRSAGVLTGDSLTGAKPRCQLYARYLERHLL